MDQIQLEDQNNQSGQVQQTDINQVELFSPEWNAIQDKKYRVLARTDLISGIFTCLFMCALFSFLALCQKRYESFTVDLNPKLISCTVLGLLSLVPLKNQVVHTFFIKRPQSKRLLNAEDYSELRRCLVDQTLYFCFVVRNFSM